MKMIIFVLAELIDGDSLNRRIIEQHGEPLSNRSPAVKSRTYLLAHHYPTKIFTVNFGQDYKERIVNYI
jgi:hypothetical protein